MTERKLRIETAVGLAKFAKRVQDEMRARRDAAPVADVLLMFVDGEGNLWQAVAILGELERYGEAPHGETRSIHESTDLGLKLKDFRVIQP